MFGVSRKSNMLISRDEAKASNCSFKSAYAKSFASPMMKSSFQASLNCGSSVFVVTVGAVVIAFEEVLATTRSCILSLAVEELDVLGDNGADGVGGGGGGTEVRRFCRFCRSMITEDKTVQFSQCLLTAFKMMCVSCFGTNHVTGSCGKAHIHTTCTRCNVDATSPRLC